MSTPSRRALPGAALPQNVVPLVPRQKPIRRPAAAPFSPKAIVHIHALVAFLDVKRLRNAAVECDWSPSENPYGAALQMAERLQSAAAAMAAAQPDLAAKWGATKPRRPGSVA